MHPPKIQLKLNWGYRLNKLNALYPQQHQPAPEKANPSPNNTLNAIVQELTTLSKDSGLGKQVGEKNAKRFEDKVKVLVEQYAKAPADKKADTLVKELDSLQGWLGNKANEVPDSNMSKKIGSIKSSYSKAVGAWIRGDHEGSGRV